jgi:hypothetical protein
MPNAPGRKILATYRPRASFSVVSGPGQPFRAQNAPTAILESRLGVCRGIIGCRRVCLGMDRETFEPIRLNARAPGGERVLKSFDDIGAFILMRVELRFRELPWWQAVRKDLAQARFGARQKETHAAMRNALWEEGWLADPATKLSDKSTADLEEAGPNAIDPTLDADALAEIEHALKKASDDGRL